MEKDLEYSKMACYYDELYKNKDYEKEVNFILNFINSKQDKILDAGCGTGNHSKILQSKGYDVSGFDLSPEMIKIAKEKVNTNFEVGNLLTYTSENKFDLIVSFYAVFNHLKSYKEFKLALKNLCYMLNDCGKIIIDLHNPQKNGHKTDEIENVKRTMSWKINRLLNKEVTNIEYVVDEKIYTTRHKFKIFNIKKLRKICKDLNLKCNFYENYNINSSANNHSKNIQMVINKD